MGLASNLEATASHTLAFLQNLSPWELLLILMVGLLFFGRRLPEVGRSLGKGIVEFKKGLKGIDDEVERATEKGGAKEYRGELPDAKRGDDRRVGRSDAVDVAASEAGKG